MEERWHGTFWRVFEGKLEIGSEFQVRAGGNTKDAELYTNVQLGSRETVAGPGPNSQLVADQIGEPGFPVQKASCLLGLWFVTNMETEAQRAEVSCPRPHSQ